MKAIHNGLRLVGGFFQLFSKSKVTINESNSQLVILWIVFPFAVFKEQSYDKWKQFTTLFIMYAIIYLLFSKSKVTINESNSQPAGSSTADPRAVFKEQSYDKWKQFTTRITITTPVSTLFSKSKVTINESNSQLLRVRTAMGERCFQRAKLR